LHIHLTRTTTLLSLLIFCIVSLDTFAESKPTPTEGFSRLLSKYVTDGFVNYQGFSNNPDFENYIHYIAEIEITEAFSTQKRLAFYINAYNALSIKGILDGSSPRTFFGKIKYFYRDKYLIAGEQMNLYDLEHKIIRPLKEPRIHFALVCASASCPKLRSEAFDAKNLERQLTENAVDFVNDKSKNDFNLASGKAKISKIFSWFKEDFTEGTSLQEYIAQFAKDQNVKSMLADNAFKIKLKKYDWSLNGKLKHAHF